MHFILFQRQKARTEHRLCPGFRYDLRRLQQEMGAIGLISRAVKSSYLSPFHKQYLQSCWEKATRPRGKCQT